MDGMELKICPKDSMYGMLDLPICSLTIHLDQMEVNIPYPTLFDLFGCVEIKALFDCYSELNAKYGLCISIWRVEKKVLSCRQRHCCP